MRRIEFIGAPGAGKTTIFNAMIKKRASKSDWLTNHEALILASEECLKSSSFKRKYNQVYNLLIKIPILKKLVGKQIFNKYNNEATIKYINENKKYFNEVFHLINNNYSCNAQKATYLNNFLNVINEHSFIDYWLGGNEINIIWEESLIHKIFALIDWRDINEDLINRYFEEMPLPKLAIYIDVNSDQLIKNVLKRESNLNRLEIGHNHSDQQELKTICYNTNKVALHARNILKNRGIKVIDVKSKSNEKHFDYVVDLINEEIVGS